MATVVPHLRLSWGGTLGVPEAEIWTNTVKWANDQSVVPSRDQLVLGAAAAAVPLKAWMAATTSEIHNTVKLTWIKLNYIEANGLQRDNDTVLFDVVPPQAGSNGLPGALWIQSCAITLRTGLSRGRGHAGRIYPPMVGKNTSIDASTGYFTAAAATAMALAFGTCIRNTRNAMNAAMGMVDGAAYDAVVISASQTGDARPPQSNEIISTVCDRVPDIQHRRTNRLPRAEGTTTIIAAIP
jgi:hypothetical protein